MVPWTSASFPASGKIQRWCVKVPWCFIGMMRTSSLPGRTFVKILSVPRRRVEDCNIPPVNRNFGVFALSSLFTSDTVTLYFFLWLQQVRFFCCFLFFTWLRVWIFWSFLSIRQSFRLTPLVMNLSLCYFRQILWTRWLGNGPLLLLKPVSATHALALQGAPQTGSIAEVTDLNLYEV